MVDGARWVMLLAAELYERLAEMPAPVANGPHPAPSLPPNFGHEHWPKPVPAEAHLLLADVDGSHGQQIFDIQQRQRVSDKQNHRQPDHIGRRDNAAEMG